MVKGAALGLRLFLFYFYSSRFEGIYLRRYVFSFVIVMRYLLDTRRLLLRGRNGGEEASGDGLRACDGGAYDYGEGSGVEGLADLVGLRDVTFDDDWEADGCGELFHQVPVDGACSGGLWRESIEGGGYGIGSLGFGGKSFVEGGDVGEYGLLQLGVDAVDELRPGLCLGMACNGAVEGDDVGSGFSEGFCGGEVGGDGGFVSEFALLDAEDGERGFAAKSGYVVSAVGAEARGSATEDGDGNAGEGVEVIERIAGGCLAGNDESIFERCGKESGCHDAVRALSCGVVESSCGVDSSEKRFTKAVPANTNGCWHGERVFIRALTSTRTMKR